MTKRHELAPSVVNIEKGGQRKRFLKRWTKVPGWWTKKIKWFPTHLRAAPELKDRRRPTNPLAPPGLLHQRPPAVVAAMAVLGRSLTARLEGWLRADPPVTHLNTGLVMWHLRLFLISSA